MKIVGLTGGIGSGKSTVADFFSLLQIPIYKADSAAKTLMDSDSELVSGIQELLGPESYSNGHLNRPYIASRIFSNPALLAQMNALVHPAVKKDFIAWANAQKSPYVIREAAILFESGTFQDCDFIITVFAPENLRLSRVMKRDRTEMEEVKKRMANQWPDEKKIERSHAVIFNDDQQLLIPQILELDAQLRK
jgi:dephospho-CoA kinase